MQQLAKLKREEFHKAVRDKLITIEEFADKIGTSPSYLSRISSDSPSSCRCTLKFSRRVLEGLNWEYSRFNELFFWAT
tara:strand:- start:101 stop:334 length:234 start_codon:yes stop_codon:yes gene_type:complete